MSLILLADYAGVFVFATSGGLVAIRHNFDVFGILVIALLPAVGGGTLRDILLDTPVFWLSDPTFIIAGLLGGIASIVYKSWTQIKLLVWADALGLALFATLGTIKSVSLGFGFIPSVIMGTITATAGGLLRDIVCNEPPMLLKSDIYATAAIFGASVCYALILLNATVPTAGCVGFLITFIIRALAIKAKLSLPGSEWVRNRLYR